MYKCILLYKSENLYIYMREILILYIVKESFDLQNSNTYINLFLYQHFKEIPGSHATEGIDRRLSIVVDELMPGELYHFQIYTTAHKVNSEVVELSSRTSKYVVSGFLHALRCWRKSYWYISMHTQNPKNVMKNYLSKNHGDINLFLHAI